MPEAGRSNAVSVSPTVSLAGITKRFPVVEGPPLSGAEAASRMRDGFFYGLSGVSLEIAQGALVVLAGANGSGKTLLMNIIAGLDAASSGTVRVTETVGLVFQDAESQILGETPLEDVGVGLRARKTPKQEAGRLAREALAAVGLLDKAEFPARFLSGGEKRRLAVAGVLAMNAGIVIFDEPYTALDYRGILEVNAQIKQLAEKGKTLVIISHELEKCLALATQFVVMQAGEVVFNGAPRDALRIDLCQWNIHKPSGHLEDMVWL